MSHFNNNPWTFLTLSFRSFSFLPCDIDSINILLVYYWFPPLSVNTLLGLIRLKDKNKFSSKIIASNSSLHSVHSCTWKQLQRCRSRFNKNSMQIDSYFGVYFIMFTAFYTFLRNEKKTNQPYCSASGPSHVSAFSSALTNLNQVPTVPNCVKKINTDHLDVPEDSLGKRPL